MEEVVFVVSDFVVVVVVGCCWGTVALRLIGYQHGKGHVYEL